MTRTTLFLDRYIFYNVKQPLFHSVMDWFDYIKICSVDCKFGAQSDAVWLDCFISGMRPSPILDRLCEEDPETLTIEKALQIAISMENSVNRTNKERELWL